MNRNPQFFYQYIPVDLRYIKLLKDENNNLHDGIKKEICKCELLNKKIKNLLLKGNKSIKRKMIHYLNIEISKARIANLNLI